MNLFNNNYENFNMDSYVNILKNIITKDTIIVNIGTDRCIGDAVAPLVGTILRENKFKLPVYGTVENPIHAMNLENNLKEINLKHPNAQVIGIDACLGNNKDIGKIMIRDKPIRPGAGIGKELVEVGEYSIVGIVDDSEIDVIFTDRQIRLDRILNLSKKIAEGLIKASQYIEVNEIASDSIDNEIKLFKCS